MLELLMTFDVKMKFVGHVLRSCEEIMCVIIYRGHVTGGSYDHDITYNRNLEAKSFGQFWVLHSIRKQVYKLELSRNWSIYDVFYILLLEQDTTKKGQVDKQVRQMEFNACNIERREYKVKIIWDSTVYANELESGHQPDLHHLISRKGYPEEKNTWEPASAI